jgi:hypothetical protein
VAENRAAARGLLDQDKREPAFGPTDSQEMGVDTGIAQLVLVELCVMVGARGTDIACAQSPASGSKYRGGDLPTEVQFALYGVGLAVSGRKLLQPEHDIGGIFADSS